MFVIEDFYNYSNCKILYLYPSREFCFLIFISDDIRKFRTKESYHLKNNMILIFIQPSEIIQK